MAAVVPRARACRRSCSRHSRLATEVLRHLPEGRAASAGRASEGVIRGYRGGYLPLQRREIERGLRDGTVLRRGGDQRARAGDRHRRAGRGGAAGYPGTHRLHLAAGRAAPGGGRARRWRCWWRTRAPARPVHRQAPRLLLRRAAGAGAASTPTTCKSWSAT